MAVRTAIVLPALLALACGANEPGDPATPIEDRVGVDPAADPGSPNAEDTDLERTDPEATDPQETGSQAEADAPPEPETAPEAPPVTIEAGVQLRPIRIGMSREAVEALGLDVVEIDPRTTGFGPYHVSFRDGEVQRVEAQVGALGRLRFGDEIIESGAHIFTYRDLFPGCVWREGGGERYSCADGTLHVRTTHSMDPTRYTVGVSAP